MRHWSRRCVPFRRVHAAIYVAVVLPLQFRVVVEKDDVVLRGKCDLLSGDRGRTVIATTAAAAAAAAAADNILAHCISG